MVFDKDYYQELIKHFEEKKFTDAQTITLEKLGEFMEITRQTWIWFIQKYNNSHYDPMNPDFQYFTENFADLK